MSGDTYCIVSRKLSRELGEVGGAWRPLQIKVFKLPLASKWEHSPHLIAHKGHWGHLTGCQGQTQPTWLSRTKRKPEELAWIITSQNTSIFQRLWGAFLEPPGLKGRPVAWRKKEWMWPQWSHVISVKRVSKEPVKSHEWHVLCTPIFKN